MLKIGDFSKLSRVSIRMLRHYDEIGLLRPVKIDPESGYRYYSENQLPIAGRITALKDMGFGLAAIGEMLGIYSQKDILERCLLLKKEALLEQSRQTAYRLRLLDTALERLRKDETMQYDVTLKTFPERYAATVRMHIPSYEMEGMLWSVLVSETDSLHLIPDDPCYCSVVFHDQEFKESDVDVEAQKTVKGQYPDTEHVKFKTLPSITVASAICKGSYDQMNAIMEAVTNWVTDNGYEFDGPAFNIYHVSPHETSDPNEFVTEVWLPRQKKVIPFGHAATAAACPSALQRVAERKLPIANPVRFRYTMVTKHERNGRTMKTETFEFDGYKAQKLPATVWLPEREPRCVLQIAHGMTEHIGRYTVLARELSGHGIVVAGFDLRGHGRNAGDPNVASFGEGGWESSIEDMHLFFEVLAERFPGLPHHMLGFSLGSFLLREYLGRYPENVAGAAILGTGYQPGPVLGVMMAVVKSQIRKAGFDGTTDFVKQLSFGNYNQKFKPNRTIADWLCADNAQLDAYLSDPLCRKNISAGLFWQLLGSMKRTGSKDAYDGWNKDTPILLLSGQDDPVGDSGKGVLAVKQRMEKAGLRSVAMQLLPDARHDLLHEEATAAAAARKALIDWIERTLG